MKKFLIIAIFTFCNFSFSQSLHRSSIDSGGASVSAGNIELLYTIGEVNVQELTVSNLTVSEGFINPFYLNFTISDGSWNNPLTWVSNKVPNSADGTSIFHDVVMTSNYTISGDISVANGSITIDPGSSLILNADLNTDDNVILESVSNSYSSLIVDGTIIGDVIYNRHVNAYSNDDQINDNDLISPPVDNEPFTSSFVANNTGDLLQQTGTPTLYAFAPFNNDSGFYENYNSDDTSINLLAGKGYRVASSAANTNLSFTGSVITGDKLVDIPVGTDALYDQWNLIGNPYPSYIDFDTFFAQLLLDMKLEEGYVAVYGYDGNASDGWVIWDGNNGNLIAPGQGFFVRTDDVFFEVDPAPQVTFTFDMRRIGSSDDFIPTKTSNAIRASININFGQDSFDTNIYFRENGTRGLDYGYDTAAFLGNADGLFTYLVEENTGLELYNQSLPYNDYNDVIIPLGVKASSGETFTISLDDMVSDLPSNINVYLEDNLDGFLTLLNTSDFVLTPPVTLTGAGRFYLHFTSSTLSDSGYDISRIEIFSNLKDRTVVVNGLLIGRTVLDIYDLQGRLVLQQELESNLTANYVSTETISSGIYVVKLNNETQSKSQKVIIK